MKKTVLAAAAMMATANTASALTLNIADGGVGCESGYTSIGGTSCDTRINDIGNGFAGDAINFAGAGTLLGYVLDDSGTTNKYADGAIVTLGEQAELTFSIFDYDEGFDGTLEIGTTTTSLSSFVFDDNNTTQVLGTFAAGQYFFKFDATRPDNSSNQVEGFYSLTVAPVPLPASALLLLAGAGALAGLRRAKKS